MLVFDAISLQYLDESGSILRYSLSTHAAEATSSWDDQAESKELVASAASEVKVQ